jgi:hypothetical protein
VEIANTSRGGRITGDAGQPGSGASTGRPIAGLVVFKSKLSLRRPAPLFQRAPLLLHCCDRTTNKCFACTRAWCRQHFDYNAALSAQAFVSIFIASWFGHFACVAFAARRRGVSDVAWACSAVDPGSGPWSLTFGTVRKAGSSHSVM